MSDADAFDLMGLEPSFRIDSERLERTHRELSAALHPDRYLGRSSTERQAALGKAIEVNAAYKLLRNPLERGQLLLQRLGVPTSATQLPPEFLMEIMELREELQQAASAEDEAKVEELASRVKQEQRRTEGQLAELFSRALEKGAMPEPELPALLSRLRYFDRFLNEADALLDELL